MKKPKKTLSELLGEDKPAASAPPPARTSAPPQRHGDRASHDDAIAALLPVYVRLRHLIKAGICGNLMHLQRMIDCEGFPVGTKLSRNVRAWRIDEVQAWLASRSSERKPAPRRGQCDAEAAA